MTLISLIVTFVAFLFAGPPGPEPERFDYLVRADVFAGMAGDDARLQHAKSVCEDALAANPKHPEALVWHGAILFFEAGQAFGKGDLAAGGQLFQQSLQELQDAVALAPDNPGVLIPRAAVLIEGTRHMQPDMAKPLLESAVTNYEHVLEIQATVWPTLGDHAKGELLFGLADACARLGREEKAREYFSRLIADAPTSGQAPRAKAFLDTGTVPKASGIGCVGCHK